MLAPLYQSEIAHPSRRGSLLALQQFMLGVGAVIAGWIGYGCDQGALGTALQWRLPVSRDGGITTNASAHSIQL